MMQETPGIRGDMEAMGLTVKLWQKPEIETSTVPPRTLPSRTNRVTEEQPFKVRCRETLQRQVAQYERQSNVRVDYAIVVDAGTGSVKGKGTQKRLLVIIVEYEEWSKLIDGPDDVSHENRKEIECNGCDYTIVGHYIQHHARFKCDDKELENFFNKEKGEQAQVKFFNKAMSMRQHVLEEEYTERKKAKKQRQKLEAATATAATLPTTTAEADDKPKRRATPFVHEDSDEDADEQNEQNENDEDDEKASLAKKEKKKAKRKAYEARKKAAKQQQQQQTSPQLDPIIEEIAEEIANAPPGDGKRTIRFAIMSDGSWGKLPDETERPPVYGPPPPPPPPAAGLGLQMQGSETDED